MRHFRCSYATARAHPRAFRFNALIVWGNTILLCMLLFNVTMVRVVLADATTLPISVETIAEGLDHPWSIAFLPDGRQLVTERIGRLNIIDQDGVLRSVSGVPEVLAKSQGGLLDVVLHPAFEENGWLYLTLAHGTIKRNATRLVRARLEQYSLVDLQVLFTAKPFKDTPVHFGGRVAFLPDNSLLLTIGDGFDYREQAQQLDNHLGKIVRLADDGNIPQDNPFIDTPGALPEIWSYGHRNPQGIVHDARYDRVISHEHGPAGGDEINFIEPGGNFGWPVATHGTDYSGARISPYTSFENMLDPIVQWTPSVAPAGLAVSSERAPATLANRLLVSTLKSRELLSLELSEDMQYARQTRVLSGLGRLRDVRAAPDGSIWVLTDSSSGKVLRLFAAR